MLSLIFIELIEDYQLWLQFAGARFEIVVGIGACFVNCFHKLSGFHTSLFGIISRFKEEKRRIKERVVT